MGTIPIPQGAQIDPQTPSPSRAVAIPQGATIDPVATQPSLPPQSASQQPGAQPLEDVITQIAGGGSPTGIAKAVAGVPGTLAQAGKQAAEQVGQAAKQYLKAGAPYPGGGDPLEDLLRETGQQTGYPFLESADKVHQALQTLTSAAKLHEEWGKLKQAIISPPGTKEALAGAEPRPKIQRGTEQTQPTETPPAKTSDQTRIWQAFPGDRGLDQLANHVIAMEGESKVAQRNNNPGNLKDPKTGDLQKFNSYQEGRNALVRQLDRWRDSNPDWTISDFNAVYAPDKSHGGDNPEGTEESRNQYLMNQMGLGGSNDTLPKQIPLKQVPKAFGEEAIGMGQGIIESLEKAMSMLSVETLPEATPEQEAKLPAWARSDKGPKKMAEGPAGGPIFTDGQTNVTEAYRRASGAVTKALTPQTAVEKFGKEKTQKLLPVITAAHGDLSKLMAYLEMLSRL